MVSPTPQSLRRAASALLIVTALELTALSHHPVVGAAASAQESLSQLAALQFMDGMVHGMLILMLAVLSASLALFSRLLGWRRQPVMFACTAWLAACCVIVGAMLLDGFAVPQMAIRYLDAPEQDVQALRVILGAIGVIIQVLTKAGILAMGAAMLAWSWALVTQDALPWSRTAAAAGAAAALSAALYILSGVRLTPDSLMVIFGAYGVWNFAVAALLLCNARAQGDLVERIPAVGAPDAVGQRVNQG